MVGCHLEAPAAPESTATTPAPTGLTLGEIADRIDPGAQEPLSDGLAPWMFELIGLDAHPSLSGKALLDQSVTERADVQMQIETGVTDSASMVSAARGVARSIVLAEQAMARGAPRADALAQLERAYIVVDNPSLASEHTTWGNIILLLAKEAASGDSSPEDQARLQQLATAAQDAIRAAGPLHRRTVAELLRTAPEHQGVPTALLAVAQRGDGADWTIGVAKLAVEQRGLAVTAQEQLDLARVCFTALDIACGNQALRAASGAEGSDDVDKDAVLARQIVELADASTLDERLAHARALLSLGRHAAAKAAFEALRAEFPGDARPVGGLARHAMETEFDFERANRIIDAQDGLKNGDAEYYELAIGTRAMAATSTILPSLAADDGPNIARALTPLVRRTRADIDGYARLGNANARPLGWLVDVGEELLAQYQKEGSVSLLRVRSLSDRAMKLQSELAANPHAYRLLMSAALFETDKARAITMANVVAPAGPDRDALLLRRARALTDLAVTWNEPSLARQAREASREVDAASSLTAAELHADAMLVQRLLGGSTGWETIGEAYEVLLDDNMTSHDARAVNNIAFTQMHNGSLRDAQEGWTLSLLLSEDLADVAELNLIASSVPTGHATAVTTSDESRLEGMQTLADATKVAGVRVAALAWILAWSKGEPARRTAAAALKVAVADEAKKSVRPTGPDPYATVILDGSFHANVGYALEAGLQLDVDVSGRPWAILAPSSVE